MARKHHAKHSKNTILASSATKSFSKLSVGAASAVVGASLALSAAPALAQEMSPTDAQQAASTPLAQPANSAAAQNQQGRSTLSSKPSNQKTPNTPASTPHATQPAQKNTRTTVSSQTDRAATVAQPQVSDEINLSADTKDTVPNMYAWGSSDNVFIENGQNHSVTFKFAKPTDGTKITKVAIFPSDTNGVDNQKSRKFLEYYSDPNAKDEHQSYSGTYAFTANDDGSATLTMTALYRDNNMDASKYAANRCIYVYGIKDGKESVLYKTNIVRAATLIPPKNAGSIVLKYNEELTAQQIQAKLKAALDAPTEAPGKKSVREQIKDASTSRGVGGRTGENGKFVQTPDDADKKIAIADKQAYDINQVGTINTVTSKPSEQKTYKTGVTNLKTYLVSDLGYKSNPLALTVARYDTRIDKPIVEDSTNVSEDVKTDIKQKLARLNHISQDKVTIGDDGTVTINFEGVDADKMPKIALKDLVLKKLAEADVNVPTGDKATFVSNPLGYSEAEIKSIKKSIYDANKDNDKLGLSATDYEKQITLEYLKGDLTGTGDANKGISNGLAENTITVKIKTDKAVAEFKSDVKQSKLTRLPDIRADYNVELVKNKLDGRDSDEGFSWSDDKHTTLIYRYDPTKAHAFTAPEVLKLIKATPKDGKSGLRSLTGGEKLDHEGAGGKARKSHMNYVIDDKGEPTTELTLGMMSGAYWKGDPQVANSDANLGNEQSSAGSYSWDTEAGSVTVAAKQNKVFKTRLFVAPYTMTFYRGVYTDPYQKNPNNTPKAINVIFVPQTNHKKSDLKKSVDEHKTTKVGNTDVPTESTYYNASDAKKSAYDEALKQANKALELAGDTEDSKLAENLKALIDNATINLNKARAELDGDPTNKDGLEQSIAENGTPAEGQQAATGTQATNQFKNVTDPDFKTADGKTDETRNNAAKEAKKAYDEALDEANKVKDDANATQKAVDAAKAKLDAARAKLNDFTTNKDELNAAIAADGKVNTGDAHKTGDEKLKTADPTYQNSTPEQRKAYDDAVTQANKVVADPNASQKEVNEAIAKLQQAKAALDANATDKSPLDAAVQKSFDNPDPTKPDKQSVFYKNAKNKTGDPAAQQAVQNYDDALAKAKQVLANDKATKKDVEDAKKALEDAETALHADKYQTKTTDLAQALADNFSGYLMPAYFNAFDKAQAGDGQAKTDFKAYNDAYHAAKDLMEKLKQPGSPVTQTEADKVKNQLIEARKVIDKYATDTSKISAALLHSLAIKASPAYQNTSANDASEDAKKAKEAYDKALEKLQKAFNDEMPKDTDAQGTEISTDKVPNKDGDTNSASYLDGIQSHAKGQPLNRDVTKLLADLNNAVADLNKFATKTDELIKSINKDSDTHPSPAFKNASQPNYQKADGSGADDAKNTAARQAASDYGEALNEAKDLLNNPSATQAQIDAAKKKLDDARTALDAYKTDTTKLEASVKAHGSTDGPGAIEGTVTSDAYRNASDPHFLTADGKPDETKNNAAKKAKADYDKALVVAQELLNKANPENNTPLDAQPTQKQINDALKKLDEKRQALDAYKTDTTALEAETRKSTPEHAPVTENDFENTPEFKNADAKKDGTNDNEDVKAYKDALAKARKLAQNNASQTLSDRPTQQQIDEALDALKQAKQAITDGYKTDVEKLKQAKQYAEDVFKKTPEYKNATAIKNDNNNAKHEQAGKDLDGTDQKPGLSKLIEKITTKLQDTSKMTQREVDALVKQLVTLQKKITENYKTDVKPLANEVGDKDQDGNPIVPAFEESVTYKNALDKQNSGDADATAKLKDYNDKLDAAQKLLDKVANPDPNAKPEDRPTNADVAQALEALKTAKKAIDDTFKTKPGALKLEADDKDEHGTAHNPAFEATTEYQNALGEKNPDGTDNADVQTYKKALEHAKKLLEKFDETGNPKAGAQDVPTQKDVDEALANLKDIKDKIKKNYVTNPHDLQEEVDKSKDGEDDTSTDVFENTPEFKNVSDRDDEAAKKALQDYTTALNNARELLDKFDRSTGKPKAGVSVVPTQKQLDDALKALQKAKQAILDGYKTDTSKLVADVDAAVDVDNKDYRNASREAQEAYDKALAAARAILKNPKATQAEIDAAQRALMLASDALMKSAHRPKLAPQQPARTNAPKHLAATSDATNTFAVMGMITSAFGLIFAGAKRKRQRRQ